MKKMTALVALTMGLQGISASADSLRIDNATIMTMGGMGTLQAADILIEDGEITAIESDLSGDADRVIDANGAIITPAMFAGATTTGLVEVNAVRESVDSSVSETPLSKLHVEFDVRRAYSLSRAYMPSRELRALVIPCWQQPAGSTPLQVSDHWLILMEV